ncbi:MAG: hypothetical protein PVH54_01830 [Gammaproteobacteria bacterium]|jgi:hypothetical protein
MEIVRLDNIDLPGFGKPPPYENLREGHGKETATRRYVLQQFPL